MKQERDTCLKNEKCKSKSKSSSFCLGDVYSWMSIVESLKQTKNKVTTIDITKNQITRYI